MTHVWGSLLVVALMVGSVLGIVAWFSVLVVALVVGSVLGLVAWFSVLVVALVVGSVLGLVAWFSVWHVHQQDQPRRHLILDREDALKTRRWQHLHAP